MSKNNLEGMLFYHKIRLAKSLVDFAERLIHIGKKPELLEEGLFKEWYQFYAEGAGKELSTRLSKLKLSRFLAFYNIFMEHRHSKEDGRTCYGLDINIEKLEVLIADLKHYNESTGGTIIYIEGVPYFMQVAMIPVDDKIKKALSGRAKSKD